MTGEHPRAYPDTATRPGAGQVPQVFEYALIRVVPRVERGESINAGVIVYAKNYRFLKSKIQLDETRLRALDPAADIAAVRSALKAFERACSEGPLA
jgi:hypothetical protein